MRCKAPPLFSRCAKFVPTPGDVEIVFPVIQTDSEQWQALNLTRRLGSEYNLIFGTLSITPIPATPCARSTESAPDTIGGGCTGVRPLSLADRFDDFPIDRLERLSTRVSLKPCKLGFVFLVLHAARRVLSRRVRRGCTFSSPEVVRDFLRSKLGTLEHEGSSWCFCSTHETD